MTLKPMHDIAELLRERLCIISDGALRKKNPEAHLKALQKVSEAIVKRHEELKPELPARLNHFLTQCSFQKALEYLEATEMAPRSQG